MDITPAVYCARRRREADFLSVGELLVGRLFTAVAPVCREDRADGCAWLLQRQGFAVARSFKESVRRRTMEIAAAAFVVVYRF